MASMQPTRRPTNETPRRFPAAGAHKRQDLRAVCTVQPAEIDIMTINETTEAERARLFQVFADFVSSGVAEAGRVGAAATTRVFRNGHASRTAGDRIRRGGSARPLRGIRRHGRHVGARHARALVFQRGRAHLVGARVLSRRLFRRAASPPLLGTIHVGAAATTRHRYRLVTIGGVSIVDHPRLGKSIYLGSILTSATDVEIRRALEGVL